MTTGTTWTLDERDGDLVVRTGVEGPAARLGHRLTIAMTRWRARVTETDGSPTAVRVEVDVGGLLVRHGQGGLKPLSAVERAMIRRSALKTLEATRHPTIVYVADSVGVTDGGYDLDGEVTIHGVTHQLPLRVEVGPLDVGHRTQASLRQSDFGVQPVSFVAGAMRVSDEVSIEVSATRS
jgi:polyisoprenoid-binding protein YceI